jgi:hypothetical protein
VPIFWHALIVVLSVYALVLLIFALLLLFERLPLMSKKDKAPKHPKHPKHPKEHKHAKPDAAPPLPFDDAAPPSADDCLSPPQDMHEDPEPAPFPLELPVHPSSAAPDADSVDLAIVPKPVESDHPTPLPGPVQLTECHLNVWDLPWGRYIVLAVPPGAVLDGLLDGQKVDVNFHPGDKRAA